VFVRHAGSAANVAGLVSSERHRVVPLSSRGRAQARELGAQLANATIELAVATRFLRTRQTVELALSDRSVPMLVEPDLDELDAGDYDGATLEEYWSWRAAHKPRERLPHGESPDEAMLRYAAALERLASREERVTLIVTHAFALNQIARALAPELRPHLANAMPYLFDEAAVLRAAGALRNTVLANHRDPAMPAHLTPDKAGRGTERTEGPS
jgi:broad specificity phosphatase PhoE